MVCCSEKIVSGNMKHTERTLKRLEVIFKHLGYSIRYEKGQFKGNYCLLKQQKILLVNRFHSLESKIEVFKQVILEFDFENLELEKEDIQWLLKIKKSA